jgi:polyisoprenyl-teichoic acid--peptidoglycan teichoic acid transferase
MTPKISQPKSKSRSSSSASPSRIAVSPKSPPSKPADSGSSKPARRLQRLLWRLICFSSFITSTGFGLAVALSLPLNLSSEQRSAPVTPDSRDSKSTANPGADRGGVISHPVNVIVMGVDRVEGSQPGSPESFTGRSDTMLLVHLDAQERKVTLLSIPRDTQVKVANFGLTKVNHANRMGGPALVRSVLRDNLQGVTIDRYMRVNTEAFKAIIDAIGGLRVFVPARMEYTDNTQKLKIDLQPGWQTLNGDQAEQFARFRHDAYGDIGRVQRQQTLLKALRETLMNPLMLPRLPELINTAQKYLDTNLSNEEILALVTVGLDVGTDRFKMVMLPGRASETWEFSSSYWIMDPAAASKILSQNFGLDVTPPSDMSGESPADRTPRIAIQNASGKPELGQAAVARLKALGFGDTYVIEDWPEPIDRTQIIVQRGDNLAAQGLLQKLAIGQVDDSSTGDFESDLTLRLGRDWK